MLEPGKNIGGFLLAMILKPHVDNESALSVYKKQESHHVGATRVVY